MLNYSVAELRTNNFNCSAFVQKTLSEIPILLKFGHNWNVKEAFFILFKSFLLS